MDVDDTITCTFSSLCEPTLFSSANLVVHTRKIQHRKAQEQEDLTVILPLGLATAKNISVLRMEESKMRLERRSKCLRMLLER